MLNGILDGPPFSQSYTPPVVPASAPQKSSFISASANRVFTGRNSNHNPLVTSNADRLLDDQDNDDDSVSSSDAYFKSSLVTDNSNLVSSDSYKPGKHSKLVALKNKLIHSNITNSNNNHITSNGNSNSNTPTSNGSAFSSTSSLPSIASQTIHSNGPGSNNNNNNNINSSNQIITGVTSMNSSSSLASNTSSTNASPNSVSNSNSNSNSNSSLRIGSSSFTASHSHHGSHGHHPLFHGSYSSSSAINGSRQQQEMKRHLNRVRNEQGAPGFNSGSVGPNINGAANNYVDSDGNRLRHYSSAGSNNSFRSTDDEMAPANALPASSAVVSRKLSDSSSIDSPLRVNRSASSLRMATSVDSQLGSSNGNNNINPTTQNNGNINTNNNINSIHQESAPNSTNNTSNNVGSMINSNNTSSSTNINNISSHMDSPKIESRSMSPALPSASSNLLPQPPSINTPSPLVTSQSQPQIQPLLSSSSPQLHSSASQPVIASSVNSEYNSPSLGYSAPSFSKTQPNSRLSYDAVRTTNTSRVMRFGRGLGPPMRAPKRESEEGLNNSSSGAVTPSLPSEDLNKKISSGSIKDREMIDINQQITDQIMSFNGSSQSKGPDDGDLQMHSSNPPFGSVPASTTLASTILPSTASSTPSSQIQIQGLALENQQVSSEEDRPSSLGPLPQLDIAGALKQHHSMQAQYGGYLNSSSTLSALANGQPPQQQLPQSPPNREQPPQIPLHYQASPASPYHENSQASVSLALEDKIERELTLERQHEELQHYLQMQEKLIQEQQKQILMQQQQEEQAKAKAKAKAEAEAQAKAAQEQQEQQNKQQANNAAAVAVSSGRKQKNLIYVNAQPYQRLELIGRGGSSKVYKAQSTTGKIYAIKRVSCDEDIDDIVLKGFKGEIDLLRRLEEEERVVKLIDYEMRASSIYVVMECGEIDLAHVLNARLSLPLDVSFVKYYANEMFRCVEAVHKHDVVHSDLKPANFLLVKGMLKIIDFGIANVVPDYTSNVHRDTQIGTPNYMAPEALLDASHVYANASSSSNSNASKDDEVSTNPNYNYRNNRNSIQSIASINPTPQKPKTTKFKVGRPSDVWSCGCIIYQMIYGRPPYGAYQGTQRMLAIMNPKVPITYPRQGLGQIKVPKEAIEAIKGCLDRDPTQRLTIEQVVNGAFLSPQAVDRRFIHDLLGHAVKYGADRGNSVTARELELLTENVWKKIQASNM